MGRLGIDFGTTNTVFAVWDEASSDANPLTLPGYVRTMEVAGGKTPVIPSLIHYAEGGQQWIGQQVHEQRVYDARETFKWMKTAICNRNPSQRRVNGRQITNADAARDFLAPLLTVAMAELDLGDEEIAVTVPVESYEDYIDWVGTVASEVGLTRYRFIDEPSAAALGYGAHVQPGNVYCVFDFGGGTLDVAVVLIESEEEAAAGRRCRVLGKAGLELGGSSIDRWMFQHVLDTNKLHSSDDEVRAVSRILLNECERAKEGLSTKDRAEISVINPDTGAVIGAEYSRDDFEELLEDHELFRDIDKTIRRAMNDAVQRGYHEDQIHTVLMLGGSSLIPAVQKAVKRFFGKDRVKLDRPLDAVARGAAALVAGVDFYDHIHHNYGIRAVNAEGDYDYKVIVERGCAYPTSDPVAEKVLKATYDGQKKMGIAIFELGESLRGGSGVEMVFDADGAARTRKITPHDAEERSRFWMNEDSPTFLEADPPASRGEERFRVQFSIDGNKRLLITARDLQSSKLVFKDYPVVKLT